MKTTKRNKRLCDIVHELLKAPDGLRAKGGDIVKEIVYSGRSETDETLAARAKVERVTIYDLRVTLDSIELLVDNEGVSETEILANATKREIANSWLSYFVRKGIYVCETKAGETYYRKAEVII